MCCCRSLFCLPLYLLKHIEPFVRELLSIRRLLPLFPACRAGNTSLRRDHRPRVHNGGLWLFKLIKVSEDSVVSKIVNEL